MLCLVRSEGFLQTVGYPIRISYPQLQYVELILEKLRSLFVPPLFAIKLEGNSL